MFKLVKKLLFEKPLTPEELIALSKSPNGYERERAIKKMIEKSNSIFLDALLVRVNDWVPQIRKLAKQGVADLMKDTNIDTFVSSLDKILLLKKKGREDHSELVGQLCHFVLREEKEGKLIQNVKLLSGDLARASYELLEQKMSAVDLIKLVLSSRDIVLIRRGSALISQLNDNDFEQLFPELIASRYSYPRCIALQIGMRKFPERIKSNFISMLLDDSADIRLVSINFFKTNSVDIRKFYLDQLSTSSKSKITTNALLGLAYAKCSDCIETVNSYLTSPLVRVREAALRAIYALTPSDSLTILLNAILDDSPRVSKVASLLILKSEKKPSFNEFVKVFELAKKDYSINGLMQLAYFSSKWDVLLLILKFYKISPEIYKKELKRWVSGFNIRQELPTQEHISEIRSLLGSISGNIDEQILNSLRFTLRPFGID